MSSSKCHHKAETSTDRPFAGPVSPFANPAAHGNICRHDQCKCGATRRTNINGAWREAGPWVTP